MTETRRSLKQQATTAQGALVIVNPAKLFMSGKTGVVASGILEKVEPNRFNAANNDYFIRGADNTLYILRDSTTLKSQLGQPGVIGMKVEVIYNGKKPSKKKGLADFHDFECFTLDTAG